MTIADVWYALFRHKWKVIMLSLLGMGAAGFLYVKNKPPYVSEAKLLVRYVVDSRSVEVLGPDGEARPPANSTESIINSEGEILGSLDLCRQVAEALGPQRILPEIEQASNMVAAAASVLYGGLTVEIPKRSSVIRVSMSHRSPEIAQQALQKLIELYFKRHAEIHRGLGTMDAVLTKQTDQVRSRLTDTDRALQDLRTSSGVLSLEDSRRTITEQMGAIRQQIFSVEAELAEYQLLIQSPSPSASGDTNPPPRTNANANLPLASAVVASAAPVSPLAAAQPALDVAPPTPASPVSQMPRAEEKRQDLVASLESLRQQERDLRELRTKAGPGGAADIKHSYTDQIGRVRERILAVETELAQFSASPVAAIPLSASGGKTSGPAALPAVATNIPVVAPAAGSNAVPATATSESFLEYKALLARLEMLHRQELEYRTIYTDGNKTLIRVRQQLAESEATRKRIELENPLFLTYLNSGGVAANSSATILPVAPGAAGGVDPTRIRALEAKLKVLYAQLNKQKQEATALEQFETQFNQLQRTRELDEKNYRHFATGLEQTRFNEALGSGKLANISEVQTPSPPMLSSGKRLKLAGMALGAGVVGGIALALLIELMLDHSVRRSVQLETSLALPLLSTIPRARLGRYKAPLQIGNGDSERTKNGGGGPDIPGWSTGHPLREHIEALRDRTLLHFEGDLRKPKLIGITGCREGAGVTTVACGLAAALSEVTEGRVLLINLDPRSQSLHPLLLGRNVCSVVDVVDAGKRETALIGNNLYVASNLGETNGSAVMQPTNISRLLPKIKMSDYDYVVFDMPPVTQTSVSGKLAGMVDLVFMVAESEKDSQKGLKRACQLLAESNANYRVVLNKFERYVPKWIEQEV
jgi:uncharacterized protein involved in exopolysaccharide biosynthesis/Mrp family chromosome partitioning ATPase